MEQINSEGWLPGWREAWQGLDRRRRAETLPHALLLTGPTGLGKRRFAHAWARALLCDQPGAEGRACGQCTACELNAVGSHPDFLLLEPADEGKAILIDPVREFSAKLALTAHAGGYKVGIICPAERMNVAAANSLLKTLEEPTANTVLLLVSSRPAGLPATIRSRCQEIRLPIPEPQESVRWLRAQGVEGDAELLLELSHGAPERALALARSDILERRREWLRQLARQFGRSADPVGLAQGWAQDDIGEILHWLADWVADMIRIQAAAEIPARNRDLQEPLQAMAQRVEPRALHAMLDQTLRASRLRTSSVNPQLLLEDLLIGWQHAAAGR